MRLRFLFLFVVLFIIPIATAPSLQAATIPLNWDSVTDATVTEIRVYELTQSGRTLLATLPRTATTFNVENKSPAQYRFTVVGFNGFWESADYDVISTPAPPAKINGLRFGTIIAAAFGGIAFVALGGVNIFKWIGKKLF